MVLLHKDPDGESVRETNTPCSLDSKTSTRLATIKKAESDLESKVTSLEKIIKERDDTIIELKSEIIKLKVHLHASLSL